MRIVTALMSCLLSLAGCNDKPSVTTIHHSSADGVDILFSKTTLRDGVARFECFASESGQCHYRVYTDRCAAPATEAAACTRTTLEEFNLAIGKVHEIRGLPAGYRECVGTAANAGCG